MRCYICDYSPDTPSLYHEELQLNNFAEINREIGLSAPSGGYHRGRPKMMIDSDGREICSSCAMFGQQDTSELDTISTEEHEELEEIEA